MSAANEPEPTALPARRAVPALPRVRPRVVLCEEDRVPHHAKPKPDADVFLPVEGRMRKSSGEASSRVSKRTAQEQCWPAWTRLCRPIFLLLSVLQFHQPRGPLRDLGHSELPHRGDLQSFLQYLMSRQLPVLWRWVPGSHLPDPLCGCRGGGVGTHPGGVRVAGDVPCPSCCPRGPASPEIPHPLLPPCLLRSLQPLPAFPCASPLENPQLTPFHSPLPSAINFF
ncbi:uncharacterized protein LOC123978514 isoform X3 [Micropterus dolomieu]|uniref:uncharacterized protein LOC123978514 isoform X3 n=1 Tax=Micropterus dolomieu TaxID=147949 RepID=UPI001E8CEAAA|nr:uncharacterized protein LOC123978514 isoform X3 [Micropterus dolomieu]